MEREERQKIVLWRKPLVTVQYFLLELVITVKEYWQRYNYSISLFCHKFPDCVKV